MQEYLHLPRNHGSTHIYQVVTEVLPFAKQSQKYSHLPGDHRSTHICQEIIESRHLRMLRDLRQRVTQIYVECPGEVGSARHIHHQECCIRVIAEDTRTKHC